MLFNDLNLNKPLLNALGDLGLTTPTPIQERAFSTVMSGKDVVGIAQTGTGKTYAYLLPILRLHRFSKNKDKHPRVLIVVPTRELVTQVVGEVEKLTTYMTYRVGGAYGGTNIKTNRRMLLEGLDMLVATPGRLRDLLLDKSFNPKFVKKLVIDEVDEMLNLGFRAQITNILELLPKKRQNLLFSATMIPEVGTLIDTFFNSPLKIEAARTGTPLEQIKQSAFAVPNFNTKTNLLKHLIETDESFQKVLVFTKTKRFADVLLERLQPDFEEAVNVIHSNKSQNYRLNTVKAFHEGAIKYLIATDIIARGIDVSEVSHVINFDLPELPENYMHRIGRTGRADKEGIAIAFISEKEIPFQKEIETLMNQTIAVQALPESVEVSEELIPQEVERSAGDKNYLPKAKRLDSQGAFHEKKAKNLKVNLANERRVARKNEKKKARRKKRK